MVDQDFLKTLTVLYVEDDTSISRAFCGILEKLFHKVILVENGLKALEILRPLSILCKRINNVKIKRHCA